MKTLLRPKLNFEHPTPRTWRILCLAVAAFVLAAPGNGQEREPYLPSERNGDETTITLLGLFVGGVAASSPWWAPPVVIQDDYSLQGSFPKYPYVEDHNGFQVLDDDVNAAALHTGPFFVRAAADWGSDFEGTQRLGGSLHLETRRRWGVDAEWARYFTPAEGTVSRDHQFGDANVIVRFAQSKHAHWWTGGGFNWFDEQGETDYAYNFTYGTDVCLGRPWVLSAQFDLGEIERQGFFRGRIQLGATWRGIEAFTGFDYLDHRDHHDGVLVAGLRAWF